MNEKTNPWLQIDADDYEKHMSHCSVSQLQKLSSITKQQLNDYNPGRVLILGVATGNGLEHINNNLTEVVYGIEINNNYIDICRDRYSSKIKSLNLINLDLNHDLFTKSKVDLIIANLILEYVPLNRIMKQLKAVEKDNTVISIVIQKNNDSSFVSQTGVASLEILNDLHRDINQDNLKNYFLEKNYKVIKEATYKLPNGKELLRIDLTK